MFIELNQDNCFVQYHEDIENVSPEHVTFVIEITNELYQALQNKMPWKLNQKLPKVYEIGDIAQFIEIITIPPISLEDTVADLIQLLADKGAIY